MKPNKPLGIKNYGSIGHLPNSRLGAGDHKITDGQERIATLKKRDKHDTIIIQEKLDGSNVGVALKDGELIVLQRAGFLASSSPYSMHHEFVKFVNENEGRFRNVLNEGERICGEWLHTAHGTIYNLPHEPFVVFDLFDINNKRLIYSEFSKRVNTNFMLPYLVSYGDVMNVNDVLTHLGEFGKHGATETIEGAIWRVERNGEVDFLCKYVRPDKEDGKYLKLEPTIINKFTL